MDAPGCCDMTRPGDVNRAYHRVASTNQRATNMGTKKSPSPAFWVGGGGGGGGMELRNA